jgi:hypothetical protein
MPTSSPVALTVEQIEQLQDTAAQLHQRRRGAFLVMVKDAMISISHRPGGYQKISPPPRAPSAPLGFLCYLRKF